MTIRSVSLRYILLLSAVLLLPSAPANTSLAQEPASPPEVEAEEAPAEPDNGDQAETDPYKVPDGTPEELFEYIQTGAQRMQPQSREEAVKMLQSLDTAAQRIYESEEATPQQRVQAASGRAQFLSMMQNMGDPNAGEQLSAFLEKASQDPLPELQSFAKSYIMQRRLSQWDELDQNQRNELVEEIRTGLQREDAGRAEVAMLMRFADRVAETPDAQVAIDLINETLPALKQSENPEVVERAHRLEGLVRRLQLPGNKMEIEGQLLGGEPVDWESYRGKVVLVDYWATWCGPCIAELPNVLAAYEAYHDKGFDVLGISLDDNREDVEEFLEARNIPWNTLYSDDPEANGWNHPMATRYAINGIPRAILVDQEGKVVNMNARGEVLGQALAQLLGPPQAPEGETSSSQTPDDSTKTAQNEQ